MAEGYARLVGAIIFGISGLLAAVASRYVLDSAFTPAGVLITPMLSAMLMGAFFGPRMYNSVKSGNYVYGICVTYAACCIYPIIFELVRMIRLNKLPTFNYHDLQVLLAVPFIAFFMTMLCLPFSLTGGFMFTVLFRNNKT